MTCAVLGCAKKLGHRTEYCEAHYYRLRRTGRTGSGVVRPHEKHGAISTAEYRAWAAMHNRCKNQNNRVFKYYGGRGLRVCLKWGLFVNFLKDVGPRPGPGYSLDRINNDKGYSKKNCRWATTKTQARNRRSIKLSFLVAQEIRRRLMAGEKQKPLAVFFNVDPSIISEIKLKKIWVD